MCSLRCWHISGSEKGPQRAGLAEAREICGIDTNLPDLDGVHAGPFEHLARVGRGGVRGNDVDATAGMGADRGASRTGDRESFQRRKAFGRGDTLGDGGGDRNCLGGVSLLCRGPVSAAVPRSCSGNGTPLGNGADRLGIGFRSSDDRADASPTGGSENYRASGIGGGAHGGSSRRWAWTAGHELEYPAWRPTCTPLSGAARDAVPVAGWMVGRTGVCTSNCSPPSGSLGRSLLPAIPLPVSPGKERDSRLAKVAPTWQSSRMSGSK